MKPVAQSGQAKFVLHVSY